MVPVLELELLDAPPRRLLVPNRPLLLLRHDYRYLALISIGLRVVGTSARYKGKGLFSV